MRRLLLFAVVSCMKLCMLPQHAKQKNYLYAATITFVHDVGDFCKNVRDAGSAFTINGLANNNLHKRDYSYSSIFIKNATFTENSAFGWTVNSGTGGCIYLNYGQIYIDKSEFNTNHANIGGVLSLTETCLVCCTSRFHANHAFYTAGAISLQAINTDCFGNIFACSFSECSAREYCGGCYFEKITDVYLELVSFERCHASIAGGAVGLNGSIAGLVGCSFDSNFAGLRVELMVQMPDLDTEMSNTAMEDSEAETASFSIPVDFDGSEFQTEAEPYIEANLYRKSHRKSKIVKGGGAIFMANVHGGSGELTTDRCIFMKNSCFDTSEFGFDIIFAGFCTWNSFNDESDHCQKVSFALSKREPGNLEIFSRNAIFDGTMPLYPVTNTFTEQTLRYVDIEITDMGLSNVITEPLATGISRPPVSEFHPEFRITTIPKKIPEYREETSIDPETHTTNPDVGTLIESYSLFVTLEPTIVVVSGYTETVLNIGSNTVMYTIVHYTTWVPSYQQVSTLTLTMVYTVISIATRVKSDLYVISTLPGNDASEISDDAIMGIIAGAGGLLIIATLVIAWLYYRKNNNRRLRRRMVKFVDEEAEEIAPETARPVAPPVTTSTNPIFNHEGFKTRRREDDSTDQDPFCDPKYIDPFLDDFDEMETELII